jgi:Lar family restriction alleviation protein
MDNKTELKPCPFCGSVDIKPYTYITEQTDAFCQCRDCGSIGPTGPSATTEAAIAAWNRRSAAPAASTQQDERDSFHAWFEANQKDFGQHEYTREDMFRAYMAGCATAQPADKPEDHIANVSKMVKHSDDMNDAVLMGIANASQQEAEDMLAEMDVLDKPEGKAEQQSCAACQAYPVAGGCQAVGCPSHSPDHQPQLSDAEIWQMAVDSGMVFATGQPVLRFARALLSRQSGDKGEAAREAALAAQGKDGAA